MTKQSMVALPPSFRRPRIARSLALCSTALAGLVLSPHAYADALPSPVITVSAPSGFDNLTQQQNLIVDVYFGRVRRGEVQVRATPGGIGFPDPDAVIELLPPLRDRAAVAAALGVALLPANSELSCSLGSDPAGCGRLVPDVAGVIFDRENFRIDVFVNPVFLETQDRYTDVYLPEPESGPTFVSSLGAIVSGRVGEMERIYNIQNRMVAGFGERRLVADLSYAIDLGLQADRLNLEWDRPGLRYTAGAMWAPGTELRGTRKLIGASIASQIDTRRDKEQVLGSPLVIYLDQRARIDILRDGRLLGSAVYSAGNQQIETVNLPDGSYDIVLRIDEPGRPIREERRLFTKNRSIPSPGRTDFFGFAGFEIDGRARGSLQPSDRPYIHAGITRRMGAHWALAGEIEAGHSSASAELAAILLSDVALVRAAGLAGRDGAYGAILQIASSGSSQLNFNFDLRHIEGGTTRYGLLGEPANQGLLSAVPFSATSYSQASGLVSFALADVRLLATMLYQNDESGRARYSVGPSVEWDVFRSGPLVVALRGELTATERGQAGFAGLSLRLIGASTSFTSLTGARMSGISGDDQGDGAVVTASGGWSPRFSEGDLSLGMGMEKRSTQKFITASAELNHRLGSLTGDVVRSRIGSVSGTQYAIGARSTIVAGGGGVHVAGKTTSDSAIIASVRGARKTDVFELLVGDQVAGTLSGSRSIRLPLPPYRAYDLRIRPVSTDPVAYDSSIREVGLYPGSVSTVSWDTAPISIRIGRLVGAGGTPLANATLSAKGVWAETDSEGFFQIEAPDDARFEVVLRNGRTYKLTLPPGKLEAGVTRLGQVICCDAPDVLLGALEVPPRGLNGDPQ